MGVKSSGVYRCEVSGDAPHFQLTARDANMTVEGESNNPDDAGVAGGTGWASEQRRGA